MTAPLRNAPVPAEQPVPDYIQADADAEVRMRAERRAIEERNRRRNLMPLDPSAHQSASVTGYGWMTARGD